METEYITLSFAMQELFPMQQLIQDHSTVFEDNNAARTLLQSPQMTPRSKHIGVKNHFFCEKIPSREIQITRLNSFEQKADIFPEGLVPVTIEALRKSLLDW